jgi:hypothetical protein
LESKLESESYHELPVSCRTSLTAAGSNRLDVARNKLPISKDDTGRSSIAEDNRRYALLQPGAVHRNDHPIGPPTGLPEFRVHHHRRRLNRQQRRDYPKIRAMAGLLGQ